MNIMVLGHGEHGKDSVGQLIEDHTGLQFCSSSVFAFEQAVYPSIGHEYDSRESCYADRRNRRRDWHRLIAEWCVPKNRLAVELLEKFDVYVGMRDAEEYKASYHLFDLILWVDAAERLPYDESMKIEYDPATMTWIDNNGKIEETTKHVVAALYAAS